jgi:TPP-dependent indolepyruvate ferredoxin oxidoreductase alpha subunit
MEGALGMSYAGKRSMVCMKHVGLNVAADPFVNSAITGTNGGMIVVVADDPSMHSSQNEQDSRFYGKFAMVPIFEPANQQEAYEMAYHGFEISHIAPHNHTFGSFKIGSKENEANPPERGKNTRKPQAICPFTCNCQEKLPGIVVKPGKYGNCF